MIASIDARHEYRADVEAIACLEKEQAGHRCFGSIWSKNVYRLGLQNRCLLETYSKYTFE